jgi:hypothetical protein
LALSVAAVGEDQAAKIDIPRGVDEVAQSRGASPRFLGIFNKNATNSRDASRLSPIMFNRTDQTIRS